ncbi:unnamed protein product [Allacma fusca]|uniref:Ion transport domain-containing protein n=1 Tax=Allacma fusca TaxID=39272 RepID=A0A8J2PKE3_9HEXA|nr:unnamed protein product [Allacma fusca]
MQNAPVVAWELSLRGVLTEDEKRSVLRNQMRRHQKETLFDIIIHKKFRHIDSVLSCLNSTGNDSLLWILNFLKTQILEAFPDYDNGGGPQVTRNSLGDFNQFLNAFNARIFRQPTQRRKKRRRGIFTFLEEHHFDFEMEENDPKDSKTCNPLILIVHQAATDGDSEILLEILNLKPDLSPFCIHTENGRTPLHAAMLGSSCKNALKCVKTIINRFMEQLAQEPETDFEQKRNALTKFVNHKDREGLTAMHLAAEAEYIEVIKYFYDNQRCDIFIQCKNGYTPLDVMYIKTPEAVIHFLNGALPTTFSHEAGNFTLEIDFRTVIGSKCIESRHQQPETDLLANMVFQNPDAAKTIVPHVIVKTFLDLKWQKMKYWLHASIMFHVICLLAYTYMVIQIFLVDYPYETYYEVFLKNFSGGNSSSPTTDNTTRRNVLTYLLGEWVHWEFGDTWDQLFHNTGSDAEYLSIPKPIIAAIFLTFAFVLILKEIFELAVLNKIFFHGRRKKNEKLKNIWGGLTAYLNSVENIFQLIFLTILLMGSTLVMWDISELHYVSAALSVIVAWSLILMHFGNLYGNGMGIYVQMLGKVIKSFLKIMGTYSVLIVAFSIAFSILFPSMKDCQSLPKALGRTIVMMTGELEYKETFYPDPQPDGSSNPVMTIPLFGHIVFLTIVVLLGIVLINLLIGLTVYDIEGLRDKSEVILRSIQIQKLFIMENSLFSLNYMIVWIRRTFHSMFFSTPFLNYNCMHLDIFVIKPDGDMTNNGEGLNGMVVNKSIKEIPKKLQKEIRAMAEDVDQYVSWYLKKR